MTASHRPAYISRATLARELECSESSIEEYVRRGLIPKGIRLTSGCIRWRWEDVDRALASLAFPEQPESLEDKLRAFGTSGTTHKQINDMRFTNRP